MRALYGARSEHDVGLYASMGMTPEEIIKRIEAPPPDQAVWPEIWEALQVFIAMGTQWRVGMNGPTGLDYGVLPGVMRLCGIRPAQRFELFVVVREMEGAALNIMNERTKKNGE